MPYNRRYKRKRKVPGWRLLMERRLGSRSFGNHRPYHSQTKTLVTRTVGHGHVTATTAGNSWAIPVNNWNDPMGPLTTLAGGSGTLIENRHPLNHDTAIADDYQVVRVLDWVMRCSVSYVGTDTPGKDYVVAWRFSNSITSPFTWTAGGTTVGNWNAIQTDPQYSYAKFSATNTGGSSMPSGGDLVITVPSVNAYCKKLHSGLQSTIANDYGPEMSGHILADVDHASNPPTIVLFCNMHVFTANGLAFAANDVSFNFRGLATPSTT